MDNTAYNIGKVIVADPNIILAETPELHNSGIATQDLRPFVELYCIRRRENAIKVNEDGNYTISGDAMAEKINFLGFDSTTGTYTVNYTDDIVGVDKRNSNEGFGIKDITMKLSANYIPEVDITFIDIKGSSLFWKGEGSMYAALHDMPPPLFKLRMKGAFGKFVEYDLYKRRDNMKVDSATGDCEVTVNFVGAQYGALTDLLIGYLKSVPFLKGKGNSVLNNDSTIDSFLELVHKGDLLYAKLDDFKGTSNELTVIQDNITNATSDADNLTERVMSIGRKSSVIEYMHDHKDKVELSEGEIEDSFKGGMDPSEKELKFIFTLKSPTDTKIRLMNEYIDSMAGKMKKDFPNLPLEGKEKVAMDYFKLMRKTLDSDTPGVYKVTIDVTAIKKEINALRAKLKLEFEKSQGVVEDQLKKITENTFGTKPTIGMVFKVIADDFDYFMGALKEAGDTPKNLKDPSRKVNGTSVITNSPFPVVTKEKVIEGTTNMQEVFIYPGVVEEFRNTWKECEFVEKYCQALTEMDKMDDQVKEMVEQIPADNYHPITPFEALVDDTSFRNEYVNKHNLDEILGVMGNRYLMARDYAFKLNFDTLTFPDTNMDFFRVTGDVLGRVKGSLMAREDKENLIKALGKMEAHNAFFGVTNDKIRATIETMDAKTFIKHMSNLAESENGKKTPLSKDYGNKGSGKFRDTTIYDKGLGFSGFNGIMGIVGGDDAKYQKMTREKTVDENSPVKELDKVLKDYASVFKFFSDKNEEGTVSEANSILYKDSKEGADSDFFSETKHYALLSGIGEKKVDALLFLIGNGSYHELSNTVADTYTYSIGVLDKIIASGNMIFPVKADGAYNSSILGKFLMPGAVEMPKLYAYALARRLLQIDAADPSMKLVSPKDKVVLDDFLKTIDLKTVNADVYLAFNDLDNKKLKDEVRKDGGKIQIPTSIINGLDEFKEELMGIESYKALMEPVYLVNMSSQTFFTNQIIGSDKPFGTLFQKDGTTYRPSVGSQNKNQVDKSFDLYVTEFLSTLKKLVKDRKAETEKAKSELASKINDPDFKSNLYYNFKSIYDRWLSGNQWSGGNLFDTFKFVTRSMQDIGDVAIIDFSTLIDDKNRNETSVFTAIAALLQKNNYQFFPLTSYLDIPADPQAWKQSFQINNSLVDANISKPRFMCMYIGSYSNNLNTSSPDHPDDSVSFEVGQPVEFSQIDGNSIHAFKVRLGLQNQSVFSDFEVNTAEFKVTDEALQIEDKIINNPHNSNPVRKSQSLLNVYNQRSYNCGVTIPFGNMCIQPTQYFELSGIPIFKGAYLIYQVEHNISADTVNLTTRFKGNRIGKYVFPIVTDYTLNFLGISRDVTDRIDNTRKLGGKSLHSSAKVDIKLSQETINSLKNIKFISK
jgi:hypothetical protein